MLIPIPLDTHREWTPRAIDLVPPRVYGIVDGLRIEVEDVGTGIRERPRHVTGETDDHTWPARDRDASHVQLAWNNEMHFVPDRWQREIQVWVTREQGKARPRSARRDCPVVAAKAARGRGHEWIISQRLDEVGIDRRSRGHEWRKARRQEMRIETSGRDDRLLEGAVQWKQRPRNGITDKHCEAKSVQPRIVGCERQGHPTEQVECVDRRPRRRATIQQSVLDRQVTGPHVRDPRVDAVPVCMQHVGNCRRAVQPAKRVVRCARQPQSARAPVEIHSRLADQLAQCPSARSNLELDLKEPVTRDDVSERPVRIVLRCREDVWDASTVVPDIDVRPKPGETAARVMGKFRATCYAPDTMNWIQQTAERGSGPSGTAPAATIAARHEAPSRRYALSTDSTPDA